MASRQVRAAALVGTLFTVGLLAGAWVGARGAERASDPYDHLDTLVRVLSQVERNYVEEIPLERLVAASIRGVLDELDPHSDWMSTEDLAALERSTDGDYTGIGIEVRRTEAGLRITRVLPGSPAARDGVVEGELLLAIDGHAVGDAPLAEVTEQLDGTIGAATELELLDPVSQQARTITTQRDEVHAPAVEAGRLTERFGYLRIRQFQRGSGDEALEGLRQLQQRGALQGLVLDLRDNPGGLLSEAVAVADLFLDDGPIVSTWGRVASERQVHRATPGGLPADTPMVVLINGRSASASEIVASALQDTERAQLVGTPTYGKGSVQSVFRHRDGSALKLTIGRYYTPSGEPVAPRDGREPNVLVRLQPATPPADEQLRRKLQSAPGLDDATRTELLQLARQLPSAPKRRDAKIPWDGTMAERLAADKQLSAALDLLNEMP